MTNIESEPIMSDFQPVPSPWDSTAYSGKRNDAPNTHGAPEARKRAMSGFGVGALAVSEVQLPNEQLKQDDEDILGVAALIVEAELYRSLGTTSPEYRSARQAMLKPYVELSPRERAAADTEAHRRLIAARRQIKGE